MKKTLQKNKKLKEEVLLELDGNVSVVEKKNGKVVSRTTLDGNVVLKCLMHILEKSVDQLEDKLKTKRK